MNQAESVSTRSLSSQEDSIDKYKPTDVEKNQETYWQRFKQNKTRVALLVTLAVLLLLTVIIVPVVMTGLVSRDPTNQPRTVSPSPNSTRDAFDDSAQANPFTPPLNQSFQYVKEPIRGINLGGWLVLEPFITPKLFDQFSPSAVDEWHLCQALGPEEAKRQLTNHYNTFITEADFKRIAEMGFNHVRIPTGHWAVQAIEGEPFVPHISWEYLLKGIQWARKYGLRVMVELHTAPGSQNGWNHSGRVGPVGFLNGTYGEENANKTLEIASKMIEYFSKPEWSNVVPIFGVLNEPAMMKIPTEKGPYLTYHDGFNPLTTWGDFFSTQRVRTILETHLYLIFDSGLVSKPREVQAEFPCNSWRHDLYNSSQNIAPTLVGEFSIATNDCAKYLNGVGLGARYDGTLEAGSEPVCATCSCEGVDNWHQFTDDYKLFLLKFMEKQMDAYESATGWFYWTYKTEDHVNPHWDYLLAWEQGFAPKDVNKRQHQC
ncbi:putative glucan 1,3-beta-glucosidase D [Choanephora cucurbitarum]|uniref:glucan 1,3-beta-glucosidase n=1 Tax=Choanephora cucurbitarum TaxID=101091 RepID=A0A1C7NFB1_9FUNG|nr:putative glucan 1,3-beta-glucosidase D [Choanephora cucurbitarum]